MCVKVTCPIFPIALLNTVNNACTKFCHVRHYKSVVAAMLIGIMATGHVYVACMSTLIRKRHTRRIDKSGTRAKQFSSTERFYQFAEVRVDLNDIGALLFERAYVTEKIHHYDDLHSRARINRKRAPEWVCTCSHLVL